MSDTLRKFQTADGKSVVFQHFEIDVTALQHLALSLRLRGGSDQATQALIDEISSLCDKPDSGFEKRGYHHHAENTIVMLARNWLAELDPPRDYDASPVPVQNKAQTRFGRSFWGSEERAMMQVFDVPELSKERASIAAEPFSVSVWAPRSLTEDVQRSPLHNEQAVAKVVALGPNMERVSALFDAALAEWAKAKISRPRSNPFAKPLALYKTAQWATHEEESSLRSGSFWMPAVDTANGLMFLSPNGYRMRDVSRGKPFDTSEAALEWGRRHGATSAVELHWSLASFVPNNKSANPTLDKIFAVKESRELGALIAPAPANADQGAPAPSRRSKGSL